MIDKSTFQQKAREWATWLWQPSRRPYSIAGGAVIIFFLLVITKPGGQSVELPETQYPVETQMIVAQPFPTTLYLYGTIESPSKTQLVSTVTSNVTATPFKEGAIIQPDDVLVKLDPFEPELIVKQRKADVNEIKGLIFSEKNRYAFGQKALAYEKNLSKLNELDLQRMKKLEAQQLTSTAEVDRAQKALDNQALVVNARELELADHPARLAQLESRLDKAQALLDQAEYDLFRTNVTTPYPGRVAHLYVAPLDRVTPGSPLIDIYNAQNLEVRAQIPSKYLPQVFDALAKDQTIRADASVDGQTIQLQLDRLSGEVQAGRGGVDAFFTVTQGANTLALGRPVDLMLSLQNLTPVISIPYTALYSYDRVFKIVDHHLVGVEIDRLGERINESGEYELLITSEDLKNGDVILSSLVPNAMSGMKVYDVNTE